ncbi:MAG: hypothetical protein JWP44_2494 [Mucilaginibacter sp.]|nr:hypothetical protein [Mucilaginibacter sp.]
MKKLFFPALASILLFTACSKKNNVAPVPIQSINGADYTTVVIGSQTWTSQNYDGPGGVYYTGMLWSVSGSVKLYSIAEANAIPLPAGWRLPTENDFYNILLAVGGKRISDGAGGTAVTGASGDPVNTLISKNGWATTSGTNSSGFNALALGYYNGVYQGYGNAAVFIGSTVFNGYLMSLYLYDNNYGYTAILTGNITSSTDRASIRFVKDN